MRTRFYEVATDLVSTDHRIAMVMADIGVAAMPPHERIINVGIREQLMIGVASGLALEGIRPIVHSYAPFLVQRPWEQIKVDLGHQDVGAVLVSVGASYDAAAAGRTHQAPEDVALLASLPGWTIHVPGHIDELEEQLRSAVKTKDRVYIRLDTRTNEVPHSTSGSIVPIRQGSADSPTVLAVGPMLDLVLEALADTDATVAYANTVRPLDQPGLRAVVADSPMVVIVEPYLEGTSAAPLLSAFSDRPIRTLAIGYQLRESRRYGTPEDHLRVHGLDPADIRQRIESFIK